MIDAATRFIAMLRTGAPIRFWAMVGASIALTGIVCWFVWIIAYGPWPLAQAARRLDILGKALWINLAMIGVIVVSLSNQKFSAKGLGGSVDIAGQDDPPDPPQKVVTTTTTEVKP